MRPRWCGARKSRRTRARGTRPPTTSGRTCATSRSSCTPAGRRRRRPRPATRRATTKGRSSWRRRLLAQTNEPESGTDHVFLRRRLTEAGRAEVSSWKKTWSVPDSEVEVVPASYSLVFREPGGRSAKAGEKLNGVQHDRRSEGGANRMVEGRVPRFPGAVAGAALLDGHKKEGEPVQRDENLIDIETDKV